MKKTYTIETEEDVRIIVLRKGSIIKIVTGALVIAIILSIILIPLSESHSNNYADDTSSQYSPLK